MPAEGEEVQSGIHVLDLTHASIDDNLLPCYETSAHEPLDRLRDILAVANATRWVLSMPLGGDSLCPPLGAVDFIRFLVFVLNIDVAGENGIDPNSPLSARDSHGLSEPQDSAL